MAEIVKSNGRQVVDYMARDYDSLLASMRELVPRKLPEWQDFESEADFGHVLLQLFAHMGDILSYYQDRVANESFLGTAQTRRSIIHHLRLIDYRLSTAAPAATELRLSVPGTFSDVLTIRRGNAFATKSSKDRPSIRFEYAREEDLAIDFGDPGILTDAEGRKYFDGIPVEEGRLIADEVLGQSDGTPDQRWMLAHPKFILRALGEAQRVHRDLILVTELGGSIDEWTVQESLAFSRAEQRDFAVEIDEKDNTTIRFGDGTFGAIPPAGAEIRATYRTGGGSAGNVAAAIIETIVDAPDLALAGGRISHTDPATGGAERETIEHAVAHAPGVFRSFKRAVTGADYEALARDFAGVGKVRAERGSWNQVTLFVAPEGGGQVSDILRANLLAYFEDLRPISTRIEVEDVTYVPIFVSARVEVRSYYSQDQIGEQVRQAVGGLLAFEEVEFGQPLHLSKFYEAIEAIEGVEKVFIGEFRRDRDGSDIANDGTIVLTAEELAIADPDHAGGIDLATVGGF